ncbi:hypothetical protein J7L87_04045 [bacterium]|nr:hypothetical protein [bacterium]
MGQRFSFGFTDRFISEISGIPLRELHFNGKAVVEAYEKLKEYAERLKIKSPPPRLAGFTYTHISALGANVEFPENSEPKPYPLISSPEEIEKLKEPEDYLSAPIIKKKLEALKYIKEKFPSAPDFIGHLMEGPVTTAMLLLGEEFLILPFENPDKAHKLLEFCVKSSLNYARQIKKYFNQPLIANGFPDDFAGMFNPEIFEKFVFPYWERIYKGLSSKERSLHSELLRVEHLPFLERLKIKYFDPGVDQYLKPEDLQKYCPCKFQLRITQWQIHSLSSDRLISLYENLSKFNPYVISFSLDRTEDLPKIEKLLEFATTFSNRVG